MKGLPDEISRTKKVEGKEEEEEKEGKYGTDV